MGRERSIRLARRKVVALIRSGDIITFEDAQRAFEQIRKGQAPTLSDKTDPATLANAFPRFQPGGQADD